MAGSTEQPRRHRTWLRRTLVAVAMLSAMVLVAAGGYLGYVIVRHRHPVTLPAPDGAYRVGRTTVEWTDTARTDPLAPQPGQPRELSVWLWYPASGTEAPRAAYAPGLWNRLHLGNPAGLGETDFDAVRTHAVDDAPVADGRFPVVVLSPGLGLAAPQYAALAENLAGHGYLVAGLTPTYSANVTVLHGRVVGPTPAGNPPAVDDDLHSAKAVQTIDRIVAVWADDARFTAEQTLALDAQPGTRFAGHVEQAHVVYAGHSLGGAASLETCRTDPRCAGAVDLDGDQSGPVARTGLGKPLMIWGSADSCVTGTCSPTTAEDTAERDTARTMLAAGTGPAWCYRLRGSRHFTFTDYSVLYLAAPLRALVPLGSIDGVRALTIVGKYLTAFVDYVVRGTAEPLLAGAATTYPEVQVQRTPG